MSDIVLRAEGLAKKYLIGHETSPEPYTALRDVVGRAVRDLARSAHDMVRGRQLVVGDEVEEYWALKNVDFEIRRGEVVGIIGRNGAGKSTLLKILSRITEPSEGRVTIRGRVASLLEVGTGFHPELTGRENIFLNGAILGMTRAEIRRKFDEIVAFAGVEKFLDTPVKRYSSGMYVRLAFAVAAHLEPEILIVDEVLAVGDAEFQKKCLGKMRDVAGDGRTVLFVSHNMMALSSLCSSAMLLQEGRLVAMGPTTQTMGAYLESASRRNADRAGALATAGSSIKIEDVSVSPARPIAGGDINVRICLRAAANVEIREAAVLIYASNGVRVAIADFRKGGNVPLNVGRGAVALSVTIQRAPLVEGSYSVGLYLATDRFKGNLLDLTTLVLQPAARTGSTALYPAETRGVVELAYAARVEDYMQQNIAHAPSR